MNQTSTVPQLTSVFASKQRLADRLAEHDHAAAVEEVAVHAPDRATLTTRRLRKHLAIADRLARRIVLEPCAAACPTVYAKPNTDFPLNVNVESWKAAARWMWCDQLRKTETIAVIGESLREGDKVVAAGTYTLYELRSPLVEGTYFGRKFLRWSVTSINTPRQADSTECFYLQQVYRVLPRG